MMHNVGSSELLNCIVEAWNQEESERERLVVICRDRAKNSAIFLFTDGEKVLAQFPIPITILQGKDQLASFAKTTSVITSSVEKVVNPKIVDLKAGMKRIDLKAEVLKLSEPKMVYTRFGTTAYVSNALIKDETGTMKMSLWNQEISTIHQGDVINIKDGKVTSFKGELQLMLGRSGSLSVTGPKVN
jgi:replication factor A1